MDTMVSIIVYTFVAIIGLAIISFVALKIKDYINDIKLLNRQEISIIEKEKSIIIDLGKETAGLPDLDIDSPIDQTLLIAYGEHINDGSVRRIIGNRDFSFEFVAKAGKNNFLNPLKRIAGRYLEIFYKEKPTINYAGIRPVKYEHKVINKKYNDELIDRINSICIDTLELCMHEHYEDCPWREQALYALDSRNQMLCGYYAFEGSEFQKANLLLLSQSIRSDGLLSICAPADGDLGIPFFSLIYPIQVYEYIEHTGDRKILEDVGETIEKIMNAFDKRVEENNLISDLPSPYWNFYEWTEGSHNDYQIGSSGKQNVRYSLILNCMYVYAHMFYDKMFSTKTDLERTKQAIKTCFYNKTTNTFNLYLDSNVGSVLGNSLAVLIGLGNQELCEKLKSSDELIPISLSMTTFLYDALLKSDPKNKTWILNDIKQKYSRMWNQGATTFWETDKGFKDFNGAGSMCHGWSAIPVYYFNFIKN